VKNVLSVAVLISGGGTTLKNLIDRRDAGELPIAFKLVISSKPTAAGLGFAAQAGIPSRVIAKRDFASPTSHSEAVFDACRHAGVDMVIMGG
jgi:phosphoribosylglycinamide formyltransferase-1